MDATRHYDPRYFEEQRLSGEFGGRAEVVKYEEFVRSSDAVLDFGCGGGFLLANLTCRERLGVEVNPSARASCAAQGVNAVASLDDVPDGWADLAISNHALEHTADPLAQLTKLRSKLKRGGKLVLCVPCERYDTAYKPDDIDKHLFTWSPMNAGHLVTMSGFEVLEARLFLHNFPPGYRQIQRLLGWRGFHVAARLWGHIRKKMTQVRVVAVAN